MDAAQTRGHCRCQGTARRRARLTREAESDRDERGMLLKRIIIRNYKGLDGKLLEPIKIIVMEPSK